MDDERQEDNTIYSGSDLTTPGSPYESYAKWYDQKKPTQYAFSEPIPIPPPPPDWKPSTLSWRTLVIVVLVSLLIGGGSFFGWLKYSQVLSPVQKTTGATTPAPTHTPMSIATPTADRNQSLQTSDFDKFLHNFRVALYDDKNYDAVQKVTDTNNFQYASIAEGSPLDWKFIHDHLVNGDMTLLISDPIWTPEVAGYNCAGRLYGPNGVYVNGHAVMAIPNANVKYDLGTSYSSHLEFDSQGASEVFVFEQPNQSGQWFWRGYTYGNISNC
ncbi:hypothetical protein KDW_30680 [Dictyobacter vulcani]|uniref:Uncharacterized protein n=1 Tax=Dictyobacter vulcani TaxID=2607529 RepID=A0A5J4KUK5_9CHLR|nr:hypothetical protein [Dictyobacter vulcani]GER88906.1 hypothetical protein KDW_30680 [Dictyobacter vulcani]